MRTWNPPSRFTIAAFASLVLAGSVVPAVAQTFSYQVPLEDKDQSVVEGRLSVNPTSYGFGTLVLGSAATVNIAVKNEGDDAVKLTGFDLAAPFSQTNNCPATLVGGAGCTVTVTYEPTTAGNFSSPMTVRTEDPLAQATAQLSGSAVVPTTDLTLSNNTVDFGAVDVSMTGPVRSITVTNTGNSRATVNGIGITSGMSDFNQSNDCAATLAPGEKCTVTLSFVPTLYGPRAGNLAVYEEASGTLYSVALRGSGNDAVMEMQPTVLTFGSAIANYATTTAQATVYNQGNLEMTGLSFDTGHADFSVTSKTCGSTLAAGANCSVTVTFAPSSAGARTSTLNAYSVNAGSTQTTLNATGIAQAPAVSADVPSRAFPNTPVDGVSVAQQVTYRNTGNVRVSLGGVSLIAGATHYTSSTTCGAILEVGSTCTASVTFTPRQAGSNPGTLRATFTSGNVDVALSGTGTLGEATVSPTSLSFDDQQVATSSAAKVVTVTNTGNRKLTFSSVGVAQGMAHFAQSNDCAEVAPAAKCTINVTFTPSAVGSQQGTLALVHDGVGGTTLVDLAGSGRAQSAALSTPVFPSTPVNSSSTATATLSNTGIGPLSVTIPATGSVTGASYSFVSTTCGPQVAKGASCAVVVRFSPTSITPASGTLAVATGGGTQSVTLGSTGIQGFASVNPSSLTFASQQTGTTSAIQKVTVTNTGSHTLTFTGVGIAEGSAHYGQTNDCGSVPVNGSCAVNVSFTPSASGNLTGTLAFTHNGGGLATVSLTGIGQAPSATLANVNFGAVNAGASSTATATLTNTGIAAISVTPPSAGSVTGTGYSFQSTTCGTSLAAGTSCTTTVQFAPANGGAKSGTLTVATGAGTKVAALSGSGNQAVLTFSYADGGTTVNWGARQVGGSYNSALVTLTNSGNAAANSLSVPPPASWTYANNTCGASLAANASCQFVMMFNPTAVQAYTGVVQATAAVSVVTNQINISGSGVAQAATLSTPSFGPTPVGSSSTATATLTNTGVGPLAVTVPGVGSVAGAGYSFVATTCPASLGMSGTCSVTVRFSPTSTAAASGTLTVGTGAGNKAVSLGSTGIQGYASISPGSLTFANRQILTTSEVQTVTVTNTGTDTLTFSAVGIGSGAADYGSTNNCGSVAVNGTCTVNVSFTPSAAGSRPGTLAFTHNGGGMALVTLSGTAQNPSGTLSSPAFPTTAVGATSTATAVLSNTGIGPLAVASPAAGSVSGAAFSFVSTTCGAAIPAGGSCSTVIRFSPTSTAAATGNFAIADYNQTHNAALSATGIQGIASLSPGSIGFANQTVGTASAGQAVTITNNGNTSLSVTGVAMTAGGSDFTVTSTTCGGTLAVNGSCSVTVRFNPAAAGARSGTVGFTTNGSGPTSFAVSGTGVAAVTIGATSFSPSTVTTGNNTTFSWSTSGAASVSVTCAAPAGGSSSAASGSLAVSTSGTGIGSCTVTASNSLGVGTSKATNVSVVAAPSASASFSPTAVTSGNGSTFSWSTSNATSASVSCSAPAYGSGSGTSGSIGVSTSGTGTGSCTVTAYNAAGSSSSRSASLSVSPAYSYGWNYSGWSTPSACGSTTSSRSVWCQRSDGTTVSDAYCGSGKPSSSQGATNYNSCSYSFSYGGWSTPNGCGTVTQTRSASCVRSDGTTVSNANCGTPVTSQNTTNYNSCSYNFSYGAWTNPSGCGTVTQSRGASCIRSDGTAVSNAYCGTPVTSQTATNYNSCSYNWSYGGWGACSTSCGTGTQSRSASCVRSDGTTVANSTCGTPATSQSCSSNAGCAPPPLEWYVSMEQFTQEDFQEYMCYGYSYAQGSYPDFNQSANLGSCGSGYYYCSQDFNRRYNTLASQCSSMMRSMRGF